MPPPCDHLSLSMKDPFPFSELNLKKLIRPIYNDLFSSFLIVDLSAIFIGVFI